MARTRGTKKREQPLGVAVAYGLATTFAVAALITVAQFLAPHSVLHNFTLLAHYNASATLPLDPLYQDWSSQLQEEDVLFVTPFSLLCGGLMLGRLAPSYAPLRRVLLGGGLLGLGVLAASLGFTWPEAIFQQNTMNAHEGGRQVSLTAPPALIAKQALAAIFSVAVCVLGAWLGLRLRDRRRGKPAAAPARQT